MVSTETFTYDAAGNITDAHITFVGHSKGGAEALANAKATNKDVIVFNPAIPNYKRYGLRKKYTAKAESYVVKGEILSTAYSGAEAVALSPSVPLTVSPLDDTLGVLSRPVFESKPFWKTEFISNYGWSPLEAHDMTNVITSLEKN